MNHTSKLLITNIVSLLLIVIFSTLLSILGNQVLVRFITIDSKNYYYYHLSLLELLIYISIGVLLIYLYWKCLILLKNIIVNRTFSFKTHFGTEIVLAIGAYLIVVFSVAALGGADRINLYIFKNLFVFFIAAVAFPVLQHKMKKWIVKY